jgi:SAM-dependent MidA family methyltransferase
MRSSLQQEPLKPATDRPTSNRRRRRLICLRLSLFKTAVLQPTELERRLIEQIQREGPITFRDFMQAALYDPALGYYSTERLKIGALGDYYTSSNVHPAFGGLLARAFAEFWADSSVPLTIVEFGPGTGQLAADVLAAMRDEQPAVFDRLTYVLVETSPAMRTRQRDKLTAFRDHIRWCALEELERTPVIAIAFSNEFVDALPVHSTRYRSGALEELYVGSDAAGLALFWSQPSTDRLWKYLERMGVSPREGQLIEINLDMIDWMARVSSALKNGFLITIDYGDTANLLYGQDRGSGTLRSFYRHRLIDSPLERIGEHDITASVNFTALVEYGRDLGFEALTYERQTAFLIRMGLIERIAGLDTSAHEPGELKDRLALKNLFVPGGVGDNFRVLIQRKTG